jgi:hypothetical protein
MSLEFSSKWDLNLQGKKAITVREKILCGGFGTLAASTLYSSASAWRSATYGSIFLGANRAPAGEAADAWALLGYCCQIMHEQNQNKAV